MLEPFQIIKSEWKNINLGIQKAKHDYHSFVFSTVSKNSPDSRTVILRDFDEHKTAIWFHSDRRSKKILHLEENKNVSALFYDKSRKVQLRINGIADIEEDIEHNKKIWDSMRPESKLCYMGPYAPSQKINQFEPNTLKKSAHDLDKEDEHLGLSRFCRIRIKIKKLDWLKLDYKGHQRLEFKFGKKIKTQWIAS
jgi:pyridoxine/pyridoxamine 5'-phosphate oxidase